MMHVIEPGHVDAAHFVVPPALHGDALGTDSSHAKLSHGAKLQKSLMTDLRFDNHLGE